MLSVNEALARILADVPRFPAETVPLHDAWDRVLAEDVVSTVDVPPWDNSAMDGYAVRAADTGEEVTLRLNETIAAGDVAQHTVAPGTASAIMTGAPVPDGADAIVMVERTDGAREGQVVVRHQAGVGDHIRRRGEAIRAGEVILRAGTRLTAAQVGHAASVGIAELPVTRRPRVAILSTGDEVVPPGQPLEPGQIYSSNNYALAGQVREAGGDPVDFGNAPDDLEGLVERLEACLDCDVVLSTGGVSVGAFDFVKEAHERLGAKVDFWKVRMKPGKPLAFGRVTRGGRTVPLFGLPGNPVSCMVNFFEFVRPWLRTALGQPAPYLPVVAARLEGAMRGKPGRARLERVQLRWQDGLVASSTGSQSSGVLTSMVVGHGMVLVPPDVAGLDDGALVDVQLFDTGFLAGTSPGFDF